MTPGTRIGPYEVTAQIGVGGMGEVYQATDTKLKRQVAIKVLPESVAADAERLARFQREAEVLASLNHPNIAAIHGLEESGGMTALAMELVEGDDLSQRIAQGAIPVDEALLIAKQIAEALEAAHEQGIIHRDLKPANIKVRPDGTVKVLDFGLAKAMESQSAMSPDSSQSPTITTPAMTQAGMILGTAAYMSPEQAKGRTVDKRSDVWAFGAVLYEMLTGKRPFEGEDVSDVMGAVLRLEPNWALLASDMPPLVRTFVQRCLIKDRRHRVADISTALFVLDTAASLPTTTVTSSRGHSPLVPLWRRPVPLALAASLLTAVVIGIAVLGVRSESQPASPGVRFVLSTPPSAPLAIAGFGRDVAISPDGARVVYTSGSPAQLYVRAIDQLEGTVLPGTEGATHPFFSPDGDWIGFGIRNFVRKASVVGGPTVTLSAAANGFRGASWVDDDTIVFATIEGLFRVPAAGGEATPLVLSVGESARPHFWPEVLPGGRAVLFNSASGDGMAIFLLDLETFEERSLIPGVAPRYSPTGHIVYALDGTLLAVPFDLDRLEVTGVPVPVVEGVVTKPLGSADFDLASNGSLVYVGGSGGGVREVVWVDRDGRETPMPGVPRDAYRDVRVSPDGTRVAIATQDDVWTYDVGRATLSRLTTHPANDRSPLWSPDGNRIVFTSNRGGRPELFWRQADGTGGDEPLLAPEEALIDLQAHDWSPDGHLMFGTITPQIACNFGQLVIADGSEATMLGDNARCYSFAAVSPDGRWIAYSGQGEVYVERYPDLSDRQQISAAGGLLPLWSANGGELFFSSLDNQQMLAVSVRPGDALVVGRPAVLFEKAHPPVLTGSRSYDVSPDGRFAMITSGDTGSDTDATPNVIVVQNWFEELRRLVPVD